MTRRALALTSLLAAACEGPSLFGTPRDLVCGKAPESLLAGDLNGDGKVDLAIASGGQETVNTRIGLGDGKFEAPVALFGPALADVAGLVAADFNGDGKLDLAGTLGYAGAGVLLGSGDGRLALPVAIGASPAGAQAAAVATGDFNRDGKIDLVVASCEDGLVQLLPGRGDGTFGAVRATATAEGRCPSGIAVGDFDGDAKADLALANLGADSVAVLLGLGDGGFRAGVLLPVGRQPAAIAIGDFDDNGPLDLAVANAGDGTVSVLLGRGDGTFKPASSYPVGKGPATLLVADFNLDRIQDLAVVNRVGTDVSVLPGKMGGSFAAALTFAASICPWSGAAADFNGDHRPDLVVSRTCYDNLALFDNTWPLPQ